MRKTIKFSKLSKAEQRVAIAKDVILQVKSEKLRPTTGTYIEFRDLRPAFDKLTDNHTDRNVELREVLFKTKNCQVCAKGALLLCDILKKNKFKTSYTGLINSNTSRTIDARLGSNWSRQQLDLIETAFEERIVESRCIKNKKDRISFNKAVLFSKIYGIKDNRLRIDNIDYVVSELDSSDKLLIAIMENIIKNKGTFKP